MTLSYRMRLNEAILEGSDLISFCKIQKSLYITTMQRQSINPPNLSSFQPVLPQAQLVACCHGLPGLPIQRILYMTNCWASHPACWHSTPGLSISWMPKMILMPEQTKSQTVVKILWSNEIIYLSYCIKNPLSSLMGKEYSLMLLLYHAVLKVVGFMGGRLHKRFVFIACPDPFCDANGPTTEDCIAVFCASSNAGAALQHYYIPSKHLSAAPPRRKNQQVLVLEGGSRRHIFTITKCNMKKNSAEVAILPTSSITLHFDKICLVEQAQNMIW